MQNVHITTDDMIKCVRAYFNGHTLNFTPENRIHKGKQQTSASFSRAEIENLVVLHPLVTTIGVHGYWKGELNGPPWDQYDTSEMAVVYLMSDGGLFRKINVMDIDKINEYLSALLPRKAEASQITPTTTDNRDLKNKWATLLNRLANLLETNSI